MARSEFEMSLNRFIFCLVIGIYMAAVGSPGLRTGLLYITGYFAFSTLLFLHIRRHPGANKLRAAVALAGDFTTISFEMHVGGAATSALYPIYLWVILGNGFRFGLRFLFLAMGAGLIGFGLVCRTTPFWLHQDYISWGLFVGLIIVPGYGGTLIRKLSAARLEAEAGNRAKSMFLASVSHSVRTPLNAIVGSTALLRDSPLDAEQNELVHKLHIGADILTSLLTGILDFMQIEADRMPVRNAPVDIASMLADLRTLLAPQARAKGLRIFVHIAHDVPARVLTDARHLHEILLNLISNALKFTDSGSITISVGANHTAAAGRTVLSFEVMDTGIGIEADAIGLIFDSFTQADSTILDRFGGTGLGLAIVKRLVLLLGGKVGVTSTVGEGSVFSFSLECETAPTEASTMLRHLLPRRQRFVFFSLDKRAGMPSRLAALSIQAEVASTPAELAVLLRNAGSNGEPRPILILECPSPTEHLDVIVPLLTMLDHAGDIPRLLIGNEIPAGEPLQLRRHITTWIGQDFAAQDLFAALRVCTLLTGTPPDMEEVQPGTGRRLQILVAEDNATNQRLVTKILERAGHDVHVVQNGEDAVVALVDRYFDLALLDVNMPVMSGLEAAAEYRVLSLGEKPVPIVALTADATPEMARRCLEAGMVDCITKPVTPAGLIARIEQLLPQSSAPSRPDAATPAASVSSIDSHPYFRAALPALDRQVVADLHALGGSDFVSEMLNGFVKDAENIIGHLLDAAGNNDLLTYRSEAHALRSAAANVGARIIHDMCGQCRDIMPAELTTRGLRLAQRFQIELARVRTAVPHHDDHSGFPSSGIGD